MSKLVVIRASAHDLSMIKDGIVQTILTSPPYFGLRSYAGEQIVEWPTVDYAPMTGLPPLHIKAMSCALGHELTIDAYIGHLVLCMREWLRVLRDDGVCWVNLGDSYANDQKWGGTTGGIHPKGLHGHPVGRARRATGLKPKDAIMIPARFALAAQADGWWLRSDIPWVKRNAMPNSQTDRPTTATEHIFLLAKSESYFYDQAAVKVPSVKGAAGSTFTKGKTGANGMGRVSQKERSSDTGSRYRRDSDWFFDSLKQILNGKSGMISNEDGDPLALVVNPVGYPGAHYAVFPPLLIEPLILASTSDRGACPSCGAPWKRVEEKYISSQSGSGKAGNVPKGKNDGMPQTQSGDYDIRMGPVVQSVTIGWQPTCACYDHDRCVTCGKEMDEYDREHGEALDCGHSLCAKCLISGEALDHKCEMAAVPCVVLDPFAGSGTTPAVGLALGRDAIAVEISEEYIVDHIMVRAGEVARELAGEWREIKDAGKSLDNLPLFAPPGDAQ